MSDPAPVQVATGDELEQHAVLPSPALTPLDHLLLEGVPRTVSADNDFHATVGQLFQAWENEDDFPDTVGKTLVRGPLFAMGPDGKPMHRISDGSGLNNLPGVFGSGGLTPDGLTDVKLKDDGGDALPDPGPSNRPDSPHQNALRKRHRDEMEELQEHDAKLLQLRKLQHGDMLMGLQRQVETAREQNNKLAEELEDCMMELRAWQEENRRVRKMLALAQGMKEAQGMRGMAPFHPGPPTGEAMEAAGPGRPPMFPPGMAPQMQMAPGRPVPHRPLAMEQAWPGGPAAGPLPLPGMGPPPGRGAMPPPGPSAKGFSKAPGASPGRPPNAAAVIQEVGPAGLPREVHTGGSGRQQQRSGGGAAQPVAVLPVPAVPAVAPPASAAPVAVAPLQQAAAPAADPAAAAMQQPLGVQVQGQNNPAALMSLLRAAMQKRRAGGDAAAAQQQQQQQQQPT